MSTLDRVKEFLANEDNFLFKRPWEFRSQWSDNNFDFTGVREHFVTLNGIRISIQQSATHYTHGEDEVEMCTSPHLPVLDPYGSADDIYAYVPLNVVADYIDELEKTIEMEPVLPKLGNETGETS